MNRVQQNTFRRLGALGVVGLVGAAALASCEVDLGSRATVAPRSFGEIVYREVCQRTLYSEALQAHQRDPSTPLDVAGTGSRAFCDGEVGPGAAGTSAAIASALDAERCGLIRDINLLVQDQRVAQGCADPPKSGPELLTPLNTYLRALLPLQDDGTVAQVVDSSGALLQSLAMDGAATGALSRLSWRDGFRAQPLAAGLPRAALSFPDLHPVLGAVLPIAFSSTLALTDAPGGAAARALLQAARYELSTAASVPSPSDPQRTLAVALRFLLTTRADLSTGQTYPLVVRDHRGVAQLNPAGGIKAPYVDKDGDGLADVDATGHFVAAGGGSAPAITPFPPIAPGTPDQAAARDAQGRALRSKTDATPLYRYIEGDQTVLAALLREGQSLVNPDKDIPLALAVGAGQILGPRQDTVKTYPGNLGALRYRGFNQTSSPLLDLAHGMVQVLGYSAPSDGLGADTNGLLLALKALLETAEGPTSRSLAAALSAMDEAKKPIYDAAVLPETATLYDDVAPVLVRMLRVPGLLADVVDALRDPRVVDLGPMFATFMQSRSFVFMGDIDYTKAGAASGDLTLTVDRAKADSDIDNQNYANAGNNRSILQRLLHLVHDANSQPFCNREGAKLEILGLPLTTYGACKLFQLDDLALYYVLSIIGRDIRDNPKDYAGAPTAEQTVNFRNALRDSTVRALVGNNALGDFTINQLVDIPGFDRYPVPQAAARMLFMPDSQRSSFQKNGLDLGPCGGKRPGTLCCNQDHAWKEAHGGVLFALEKIRGSSGNFYDTFAPLVKAFARHDECYIRAGTQRCVNGAKILVDLMSVLHRHWSTKDSRAFTFPYEMVHAGTAAVRYEPLVARLMGQGDLWPSTLALAPALSNLTFQDDKTGLPVKAVPVIASFLRWFFDPGSARLGGTLTFRDGTAQAVRADGQLAFTPTNDLVIPDVIEPALAGKVTPYWLLADAFQKKRARLAADPAIEKRWKAAVSDLADQLLQAKTEAGGYKFADPRIRPVMLALLDLVRDRLAAHSKTGDLAPWVSAGLVKDLSDSLTGPLMAGAVDLLGQIENDDAARRGMQRLLAYLLDSGVAGQVAPQAFQSLLATGADALQLALDDTDLVPILRALGPAFDPDHGAVPAALALMRRAQSRDPQQVLLALLRNAYASDGRSASYPIFRMTDAVFEINRVRAGQSGVRGTDLSVADVSAVARSSGDFMADKARGVSRFLDIVRARRVSVGK